MVKNIEINKNNKNKILKNLKIEKYIKEPLYNNYIKTIIKTVPRENKKYKLYDLYYDLEIYNRIDKFRKINNFIIVKPAVYKKEINKENIQLYKICKNYNDKYTKILHKTLEEELISE